jgi:hypothetical protein
MKKLLAFCTLVLLSLPGFCQAISGTYAIKNAATGIVLRIKDANTKNGTPIVAYTPVNWKCVTWDFKQVDGQTYQLKNLFSGKTLQPQGEAKAGASLEEQPIASQQYDFIPADKGAYRIRVKGTELYLTPSDDKGTVNNNIVLAAKSDDKLQQWVLVEQHPTM